MDFISGIFCSVFLHLTKVRIGALNKVVNKHLPGPECSPWWKKSGHSTYAPSMKDIWTGVWLCMLRFQLLNHRLNPLTHCECICLICVHEPMILFSVHQSFMKKLSELEVHSWCGEFLPLFKEHLISRHHPTEQGHPCWSHCMVCHHSDLQTMSESDTCMNILLTWRANSRSCKTSQSISINFCWIRFTFCGTLTQTSIAYELWENIQAITSMQHVRSHSWWSTWRQLII